MYTIYNADIVDWLQHYRGEKFHAVLSDPPYGLAFMGKSWDTMSAKEYHKWVTQWATLLLDVVYPGAVLVMFGGTRTYHRLACGLEDAGWDIFDSCMYLYGSGFPKSHDISLALDKAATAEATQWFGYGTALTRPGIVYDPFMGSGTTALVAQRLGRHFIGTDINSEYVELARDRLRYCGDDKRMVKEIDKYKRK